MEIDPPDHMSQAENAYQDQTDIDQPETSQVENDYQDQTEIDQPQMRQGENDYQEVQCLIDQTEIEISQEDNIHNQEVQRLGAKLIDGAQKTEFFFSSACIYRVPKEFREKNESAYTPRLIAIGPLHRYDEHLQTPMQHVKLSYANNLLCRLTKGMEDLELKEQMKLMVLGECVAAMKTSLDDAKKCYAEEVTVDEEMMLVDGCFILEFLYRLYCWYENYSEEYGIADPIFSNECNVAIVQHDLLLLENQIPFLVLQRLFSLTLALIPNCPYYKLSSLTGYVFLPMVADIMSTEQWSCTQWNSTNNKNDSKPEDEVSSRSNANYYHHILHKLHDDYFLRDQIGKRVEDLENMPSASELVYAGIKFVSGTGNNLHKVKFTEPEGPFWWCCSARFEIPSLPIFDWTELLLRNFIAFEQCCPDIPHQFTSYARLMDMLVNSNKDVQVLEKAGVVRNWLGAPEDATNLFNNLFKEVLLKEFVFADACNRATMYSKRSWPKNMAYLRRQYFASPWKFIAFCLAFVAFGIGIAQLVVSILK